MSADNIYGIRSGFSLGRFNGTENFRGITELNELDQVARGVSEALRWVRKDTLNVDNVQSGNLLRLLKGKAVAVTGLTPEGKHEIALVLPTISTNTIKRKEEVRDATRQLQMIAIHNAVKEGYIPFELAESKMSDIESGIEPEPQIRFQNTPVIQRMRQLHRRRARQESGGDIKRSGPTVNESNVLIVKEPKRKISKKEAVVVGGVVLTLLSCNIVDIASSDTSVITLQKPTDTPNEDQAVVTTSNLPEGDDQQVTATSQPTDVQTTPQETDESVNTPQPDKTATPEATQEEWTTVLDDEGIPIEIIDTSTGEVTVVTKGAFEWQETFIIWDEKEKTWMEPVPIYTMEELVSQAPIKEEMTEFLKSDKVVRATDHLYEKVVPLGVGEKYVDINADNALGRELEVIIWDEPKLVHLYMPDVGESVLVEMLPAVITGGQDNLDNPNYILINLGKERYSPIAFGTSATEKRKSTIYGRGTHYLYELRFEDVQEAFIPGRQMWMVTLCGYSDREGEQKYRDMINGGGGLAELMKINFSFYDSFGASMEKALANLRRGGSVEPGTYVGSISNIVLTATKHPSDMNVITSLDELFELK